MPRSRFNSLILGLNFGPEASGYHARPVSRQVQTSAHAFSSRIFDLRSETRGKCQKTRGYITLCVIEAGKCEADRGVPRDFEGCREILGVGAVLRGVGGSEFNTLARDGMARAHVAREMREA